MITSNFIYQANGKMIWVAEHLNTFQEIGITYFLCYEVVEKCFDNENISYEKVGIPFVLSYEEVEKLQHSNVICDGCMYMDRFPAGIPKEKKYWYGKCILFREGTRFPASACSVYRSHEQSFPIKNIRSEQVEALLHNALKDCEVYFSKIKKNNQDLPDYPTLFGELFDEDIERLINWCTGETIIFVNDFEAIIPSAYIKEDFPFSENSEAFSVQRKDFDIYFFRYQMRRGSISVAIIFPESNDCILFYRSHVYLYVRGEWCDTIKI